MKLFEFEKIVERILENKKLLATIKIYNATNNNYDYYNFDSFESIPYTNIVVISLPEPHKIYIDISSIDYIYTTEREGSIYFA